MNKKTMWYKATKKPITIEYREVVGKEFIKTIEGVMEANEDIDYIIKGIIPCLYFFTHKNT